MLPTHSSNDTVRKDDYVVGLSLGILAFFFVAVAAVLVSGAFALIWA